MATFGKQATAVVEKDALIVVKPNYFHFCRKIYYAATLVCYNN
jgi:hypothetical protein